MDEHNFEKYTNYWAKSRLVAKVCAYFKPKSVLDVGCGEGKTVKLLRDMGIDAYGIDTGEMGKYDKEHCIYGDARYIPFKDKRFDIVVSNDFFEHIVEEEIDQVYNEMKRVGKKVIARISLKEKDNHFTVKPISWWKEKLPGCHFIGKDWR